MKDNYDVKLIQWLNKIIKYTLLMSKDSFTVIILTLYGPNSFFHRFSGRNLR